MTSQLYTDALGNYVRHVAGYVLPSGELAGMAEFPERYKSEVFERITAISRGPGKDLLAQIGTAAQADGVRVWHPEKGWLHPLAEICASEEEAFDRLFKAAFFSYDRYFFEATDLCGRSLPARESLRRAVPAEVTRPVDDLVRFLYRRQRFAQKALESGNPLLYFDEGFREGQRTFLESARPYPWVIAAALLVAGTVGVWGVLSSTERQVA